MISKYVVYKVKNSELETVVETVRTFLAAIKEHEPETVYEAYQTAEPTKFIHVMHFTDEAAAERHSKSTYTDAFVNVLYPRCEAEPIFTDIMPIASQ